MKIKIHPAVRNRGIFRSDGFVEALDRAKFERVIAFARPPGISGFEVEFVPTLGGWRWSQLPGKRSPHWSGRAYIGANRVVIRVPIAHLGRYARPEKFVGESGSSGYQGVETWTPEESLVSLVAHELRHLWQRKVRSGWRVWGARGRYSERDADCYAIRVVRAWRRRTGP